MAVQFRDWLKQLDSLGEIRQVCGADCESEIGAIANLYQSSMDKPMLVFDEIPGYEKGYRVAANTLCSMPRLATALGFEPSLANVDLVRAIKQNFDRVQPLATKTVSHSPWLENRFAGAEVDLLRLPTPLLHELDGGKYFGTGAIVIMKDPDSGWINVGVYRIMLADKNTLTIHIVTGRHAYDIRNKYWARGEACPVAVATGVNPLVYLMAGMELPWNANELEIAGGWLGKGLEVISGPTTGLPIPADAEIVVEGFIPPEKTLSEGPFGEWRGFYSKGNSEKPAIDISYLAYRNDPILVSSAPGLPPNDTTYARGVLRAAMAWHQLDKIGVPGVKGAWVIPEGGDRPLLAIAVDQLYPGHAKQAGMIAAFCPAFNYGGVAVIVVDGNIDVSDKGQLFWKIATAMNPDKDIQILLDCWNNPLFKSGDAQPGHGARVVIDATVPWEMRQKMSAKVEVSDKMAAAVKAKWPELF